MIFYNDKISEWSSVYLSPLFNHHMNISSPFLMRHISEYDDSNDILYTGLGMGVQGFNHIIYSYNFLNKEWKEIGSIAEQISLDFIKIEGLKTNAFIKNNIIYTFDFKNRSYSKQESPLHISSSLEKVYLDENSKRLLIASKGINSNLNLSIINKDIFFKGNKTLYNFKEKSFFPSYYLALTFLLLLIVIFIYLMFNRNITYKMLLNKKGDIENSLIKYERDFFRLMISNYPKKTKFNDLGDLFEIELAYETRVKKINSGIVNINSCAKKILSTRKNIFIIEKSKEDSRMKEIKLNISAENNK